jgi:hypothetical protein
MTARPACCSAGASPGGPVVARLAIDVLVVVGDRIERHEPLTLPRRTLAQIPSNSPFQAAAVNARGLRQHAVKVKQARPHAGTLAKACETFTARAARARPANTPAILAKRRARYCALFNLDADRAPFPHVSGVVSVPHVRGRDGQGWLV